MRDFKEIYSEDGKSVVLTLGIDGQSGKLVVRAPVPDDRGRTMMLNLFTVDTAAMKVEAGVREVGRLFDFDLESIQIDTSKALIRAGGGGGRGEGQLEVMNKVGSPAIRADGSNATLTVGTRKGQGTLELRNKDDEVTVVIAGAHGNMTLGGAEQDGDLTLRSHDGGDAIRLNGSDGSYTGGGNGVHGRLRLQDAGGTQTVDLIGEHGNLVLGGPGADGDVTLKSEANESIIRMDAQNGNLIVGGVGVHGSIKVRDSSDVDRIRITGSDGDIRFLGADLAEEFPVSAGCELEPGTVVVLDEEGAVMPCADASDRRVAGVIAGAGCYRPAMILDQQGGPGRQPVAMVGKVFTKVTTVEGAIAPGDLLCTSDVTGHAQRVENPRDAIGSVIGKALAPLRSGSDLIPVLVNLQ